MTRSPRGLLFTDLDGTLLDFDTYEASDDALLMVSELAEENVWTIPVSSKTAAELAHLSAIAAFAEIAVVEGGAVLVNADGTMELLGMARADLIEILRALQSDGWRVRGMSEMTPTEVCDRTGLSLDGARRALDRQASEPFVATDPETIDARALDDRVRSLGAALERGGRFWHLMGKGVNKGAGVRRVLERLDPKRSLVTAAVGDAWNDLPMLAMADRAFLLGDAVPASDVAQKIERLPFTGPAGFVEAVRRFRHTLLR